MNIVTEPAGSILQRPRSLAAPYLYLSRTEPASSRQLTSLLEQIDRVTRDAAKLVLGREKADLTTCLESGSWSAAECFDHLTQTTTAFLPAISQAVSSASPLTSNRALRTGTLTGLVVRNLEPPYRLRYKVLPQIAPRLREFDAAWDGFLESQSRLSDAIRSAAGLAIDRVRLQSPVYARVSYNLYGAFRILAAHERRHLWQVQQILEAFDRNHEAAEVA